MHLQRYLTIMAQLNYPYPVKFAGSDLPAWPARQACARFAAVPPSDFIQGLRAAVSVATNTSGQHCKLPKTAN